MWTLVPTAPFVLQMTGGDGREILLFVQSVRLQSQFSVFKISSQAQPASTLNRNNGQPQKLAGIFCGQWQVGNIEDW